MKSLLNPKVYVILFSMLLTLVLPKHLFAQNIFTVTVDDVKPTIANGEKVYGVVGVSYLQQSNSGPQFFPSKPTGAVWHYDETTIRMGWDVINKTTFNIASNEIDRGAVRLYFHPDLYNQDGSKWGQFSLKPDNSIPANWARGTINAMQPTNRLGGYKPFDFIDIPVSEFLYDNKHHVYSFQCGGKNKGILFDISIQTANAATNQMSPDAIHAGQAFTSLMQENKYVFDNAGKFNTGGITLSTNSNPNFGNGYFAGGSKNGSFYYNSRKQDADNRTAIWGKIIEKYRTHDSEHGDMGWPTTSQAPTTKNNGEFAHFQNGSIYWSQATGSHTIFSPIKDKWNSVGGYEGKLGLPTTDGTITNDKNYQEFEGGLIMGSEVYYKNTPVYKTIVSKYAPLNKLKTQIN